MEILFLNLLLIFKFSVVEVFPGILILCSSEWILVISFYLFLLLLRLKVLREGVRLLNFNHQLAPTLDYTSGWKKEDLLFLPFQMGGSPL